MALTAVVIVLLFLLILVIAGRRKPIGHSPNNNTEAVFETQGDSSIGLSEIVTMGERIYKNNCASCHGESGEGNGPAAIRCVPPPANFKSGRLKYGSSPDQIYQTITNGVKGTMMASYRFLSDHDRLAVAHYVGSLVSQ